VRAARSIPRPGIGILSQERPSPWASTQPRIASDHRVSS
jgi:hypothetical protein